MERRTKIVLAVGGGLLLAMLLSSGNDSADGVMDNGPTAARRQRILDIALGEARAEVREDSTNPFRNRSPRIDEYNRYAGPGLGSPYCASFVTWAVGHAYDRSRKIPWMSGSTSALMIPVRDAYRAGKLPAEYVAFGREPSTLSRIKPGWVILTSKGMPDGSDPLETTVGAWLGGHAMLVTNTRSKVRANHFHSVDGNTTGGGATLGGVYETLRPWANPNLIFAFDPVAATAVLNPEIV